MKYVFWLFLLAKHTQLYIGLKTHDIGCYWPLFKLGDNIQCLIRHVRIHGWRNTKIEITI